jgi:hypothetical protein
MLKSTLRFHSGRDRNQGDGSARDGQQAAEGVIGSYLDALDLSTAIIGDDVVLEESSADGFVLHQVVECRARRIGAFKGASDAWVAIDELDDIRAGRRGA